MSHYFLNDENLKHNKKKIFFEFRNKTFEFISDNGVFSKNEIDEGSKILLDTYLSNGKVGRTLDVGSGIGVLGITISKINDCKVDMLEINRRAVDLCLENIKINNADKCNVYESNVYEKVDGMYDVVVSNPPIRAGKTVVFEILGSSKKFLNINGELWVVIRKNQGADSARKKMIEVYGNGEVVEKSKGFYILKSVKKD